MQFRKGLECGKRKVTEYDVIRTKELQTAGFQVLRFCNNEVLHNIEAV
jgi:very-short-patch-repair endonuclease